MEMVRHQAVREEADRYSFVRLPHEVEELIVVVRSIEETVPPDPAVDDVENEACRS
jgi:hypothetical protein